MAKFDYSKAHLVAVKLIDKFGQAGVITKLGNKSGVDGSTGAIIPAVPDEDFDCVVTPLLQYKQAEIDGQNVLATDSYVFVDTADAPAIGYSITINGNTYRVQDITVLNSVDDIQVYTKLQLRR